MKRLRKTTGDLVSALRQSRSPGGQKTYHKANASVQLRQALHTVAVGRGLQKKTQKIEVIKAKALNVQASPKCSAVLLGLPSQTGMEKLKRNLEERWPCILLVSCCIFACGVGCALLVILLRCRRLEIVIFDWERAESGTTGAFYFLAWNVEIVICYFWQRAPSHVRKTPGGASLQMLTCSIGRKLQPLEAQVNVGI